MPERRAWFHLSRQMATPVALLQKLVSSKEFAEWRAFEVISPGEPERGDARIAQLIMWLDNKFSKSPLSKKLKPYLLKFKENIFGTKKKKTKKQKKKDIIKIGDRNKNIMSFILGVGPNKKKENK